jgi:hypothetical protein
MAFDQELAQRVRAVLAAARQQPRAPDGENSSEGLPLASVSAEPGESALTTARYSRYKSSLLSRE